jgi:hypothetical protein
MSLAEFQQWRDDNSRIFLLTSKSYSANKYYIINGSPIIHSPVAQSVERVAVNHLVGSSSLSRGAIDFKGLEKFTL